VVEYTNQTLFFDTIVDVAHIRTELSLLLRYSDRLTPPIPFREFSKALGSRQLLLKQIQLVHF
jgi:hypothetical protein